jgi:hypothetical protein
MVKFVSYDGKYPNLCFGDLILEIDGKEVLLSDCMRSGGSVSFTDDWSEVVSQGEWEVDIPEEYKQYKEEIGCVVNSNVRFGCCGGCA